MNLTDNPVNQADIQSLYAKFTAPLAGYAATSSERKELAEMLGRNLWTAMIAGPEMEEETWKVFKEQANLSHDALLAIQQLYFDQMKPVVTDEQLVLLRQRYRLARKE
jgi:hypothetical protein